jgi:hypothetical protein
MPTDLPDAYALLRVLLAALGPVGDVSGRAEQIVAETAIPNASLWQQLVGETDYHGVTLLMAPIVGARLRTSPGIISDDARRSYFALAIRHRQLAAIREAAVDRLLAGFAAAAIPIILLKGAALAHLIYSSPELRPMLDIDVLIDRRHAEAAVRIASDLGFVFASRHGSKFAGRSHHIPVGEMVQSGFRLFLEIHIEALHLDQPRRLNLSNLASKPRPFDRGAGPAGLALGHTDMLRHLAGHAFDHAHRIRLIHLYDLWRYQAIFNDQIDWREIETRFGYVMVVLRLVSQVFAGAAAAGATPVPAGLGLAMIPLSEIAASDMSLRDKLGAIFNPPAFWLHGFYGVPPEQSLWVCRIVRHPAMLARWLLARAAGWAGLAGDWNWVSAFNRRPTGLGDSS